MKIDYSMEKFAQSQGCVRTHADHSEGPSVGHVIACAGGCQYGPRWSWSKDYPVQTFYDYRKKTPHFNMIMEHNRVGCSAEKEGNTYCVYCVLKTGPYGRGRYVDQVILIITKIFISLTKPNSCYRSGVMAPFQQFPEGRNVMDPNFQESKLLDYQEEIHFMKGSLC